MKAPTWFVRIDKAFICSMKTWSVPALRIALGVVFFWFGALKLAGVSPVYDLIRASYWFVPIDTLMVVLGVWEMLVGLGLLFGKFLRTTLFLLWLQMLGTLTALVLAPGIFFQPDNVMILTTQGEFVVKNLVLIAASFVIGGHEVRCAEAPQGTGVADSTV